MSFTNPLVPAGSHHPPHSLWSFQIWGIIKFPSLFKMAYFHQQSHCLMSSTVYWQKLRTWRSKLWKNFIQKPGTRFFPLLRPNGLGSLMLQGEPWQALADVMQDAIKLPFFRIKPYKEVTEEILSTKFCLLPEQQYSCIPEVLLNENPPCNWIFSSTSFKTTKKVKSYSSYRAKLTSSCGFSSYVCHQHNTQNSLCSDH